MRSIARFIVSTVALHGILAGYWANPKEVNVTVEDLINSAKWYGANMVPRKTRKNGKSTEKTR